MAIALYEHNETAYKAAMKLLSEKGKAAVIIPPVPASLLLPSSCVRTIRTKRYAGFRLRLTFLRPRWRT